MKILLLVVVVYSIDRPVGSESEFNVFKYEVRIHVKTNERTNDMPLFNKFKRKKSISTFFFIY